MKPLLAWSHTYLETIRPNDKMLFSGSIIIIIIVETQLLPSSITSE
jgi:hypothetical protein